MSLEATKLNEITIDSVTEREREREREREGERETLSVCKQTEVN